MKIDGKKTLDILLRQNYVTEEDINQAKDFVSKHDDVLITDYLLSEGVVTKDLLGQAIAEALHVVYIDLNSNAPTKQQILRIPEEIARKFRVVFFSEDSKSLVVASDDPIQPELNEELKNVFPGKKISVGYSLSEDINNAFVHYKKPLETRFAKIIEQKKHVASEIIDEMIEDALTFKASDIHFEPKKNEVIVRFRVDGVLHEAGSLPKEYYDNILNRIKVQARMRIDEHTSAQDGSFRYQGKDSNDKIDLRISVVPTLDGEKIVIRVLAQYIRSLNLTDLGLNADNQNMLEKASKKPFGMILATGPTGSGKTTTLYAVLKLLNNPEVNITTIEDPVEYKISGVNQIQINNQTNLTFAKGLRSIIRQDPDVILVGEIRDEETAEIAVNAALTGHLLLSTFHSNDAATAIPRLLDMGVEPFLLASTLELVIAQRLVRKICEHCKMSTSKADKEIKKSLDSIDIKYAAKLTSLYKGKGCSSCGDTGYKGRIAIFEFIQITSEMEDLILKNPSKQEIWKLAREQGASSLFEDGLEKVKNGETTLMELLRIASPPRN